MSNLASRNATTATIAITAQIHFLAMALMMPQGGMLKRDCGNHTNPLPEIVIEEMIRRPAIQSLCVGMIPPLPTGGRGMKHRSYRRGKMGIKTLPAHARPRPELSFDPEDNRCSEICASTAHKKTGSMSEPSFLSVAQEKPSGALPGGATERMRKGPPNPSPPPQQ
jgi:hypothetical protein